MNPRGFLCDWESGVGGVGGYECQVALLRQVSTVRVGCTCRDAIDEELGPFDVGLGGRGKRGD